MGLANFTTYYYVIRAFDATQESVNSNEASVLPIDNIPSDSPTRLSAADLPNDQGFAIDLTWTRSGSIDVTEQRIYRSLTAGGSYTLIATIAGNTTAAYTDTGLANFTPYYYIVRAFDATQESANSPEASAVPVDNIAPDAPTGLTAADHPNDEGFALDLRWVQSTNLANDVVAQRVYRSLTSGGPYTLIATFAGNATSSYTDVGLTNFTPYYYVIRAFDATQESVNSNEAFAVPIDNIPPDPPTGLSAADHPNDQGFAIDLTWTRSGSIDVTEQRIYRSLTAGGSYTLIATIAGHTTAAHTHTG